MSDEKSDELRESIAKRLRQAREAAGLSQGQVARKLQLHRPTVSEIEAGRRKVSSDELAAFSELYEVDVRWLLGESHALVNEESDPIQIAAREISKMSEADIERLMTIIQMVRKSNERDD